MLFTVLVLTNIFYQFEDESRKVVNIFPVHPQASTHLFTRISCKEIVVLVFVFKLVVHYSSYNGTGHHESLTENSEDGQVPPLDMFSHGRPPVL